MPAKKIVPTVAATLETKTTPETKTEVKEIVTPAATPVVKPAETKVPTKELQKQEIVPKKATPKKVESKKMNSKKVTPKKVTTKDNTKHLESVCIEFGGRKIITKDVVEKVKAVWTNELGNEINDLNDLKVYIKPEEFTAYFVMNDNVTGRVDL